MVCLFLLAILLALDFFGREDRQDERCSALSISLCEIREKVVLLVPAAHVLEDYLDAERAVSLGCQV